MNPNRKYIHTVSVYSGTSTNKHQIMRHMFKLRKENQPHNNSVYFVPRTSEITIRFSSQLPWWLNSEKTGVRTKHHVKRFSTKFANKQHEAIMSLNHFFLSFLLFVVNPWQDLLLCLHGSGGKNTQVFLTRRSVIKLIRWFSFSVWEDEISPNPLFISKSGLFTR